MPFCLCPTPSYMGRILSSWHQRSTPGRTSHQHLGLVPCHLAMKPQQAVPASTAKLVRCLALDRPQLHAPSMLPALPLLAPALLVPDPILHRHLRRLAHACKLSRPSAVTSALVEPHLEHRNRGGTRNPRSSRLRSSSKGMAKRPTW